MSYCRIGADSSVYIISNTKGWTCYHRTEQRMGGVICVFRTMAGFLSHLRAHQRRGDKVPQRVFDRLRKERKIC